MTDISISRNHNLKSEDVRDRVQDLIEKLIAKHGGTYKWQGEKASYSFSGVDANLDFDEEKVNIEVTLGFMMKAFKTIIENEITDYMDKHGMT